MTWEDQTEMPSWELKTNWTRGDDSTGNLVLCHTTTDKCNTLLASCLKHNHGSSLEGAGVLLLGSHVPPNRSTIEALKGLLIFYRKWS